MPAKAGFIVLLPCFVDCPVTSLSVTVKSTSWEVFAGLPASLFLIFFGSSGSRVSHRVST